MADSNVRRGPVLFSCLNFSGLVNPMSAIAAELAGRDRADVWFSTNEERAGEIGRLADGRVRFSSLGPTARDNDPATMDQRRYDELHRPSKLGSFAALVANSDFGGLDAMYRRTVEIIDEIRPSLVFADTMSVYALDAAVTRGVPYALSHANPVSSLFAGRLPWSYPTPLSGLPRRMTAAEQARNVLFRIGRGAVAARPRVVLPAMAHIRERKRRGQWNPAMSFARYVDRAAAIVAHSVFGLEYPFAAAPEKLRMLGAMVPPERGWGDGELLAWLDRHESVVYIGFGTMMRQSAGQVRSIVEAARRLGPAHQVLWKVPKSQQHLLPDGLPGNLRIVDWVPSQLSLLDHPHVRVFFNQAGGNATHEGLYFGKPMLMLPFWLDCHDFAVRAVDAGAALTVANRAELDAADIAAKLTRLLTEAGFRERAVFWGERLRTAGGVPAAADLLLELSEATAVPAEGRPR